jgi:hypothetical protein
VASPALIILDIEATGLAAEVLFNGVAMHRSASPDTVSTGARLNGWVQSGPNALSVRLAQPPPPPGQEPPQPAFELKLRRAVRGTPDEADQILAQYRWTPARPLGPAPVQVFAAAPVIEAVQPWSWTRGYAFTALTPADRDAIAALLRRLRDALADRRVEEVLELQRVQVSEQAVAVGASAPDMLDRYVAFLRDRMGSADWQVAPFDAAGMRTELMADGRVVHVTAADGGPPLVSASSDGRFAIDPYLSRIDGRWTIVR